jgi:hypothetical protein
MPENQEKENPAESLESSLEVQDTVVEKSATDAVIDATQETVTEYKPPKKTFAQKSKAMLEKVNVYVLIFVVILALAGFGAFVSYKTSKNAEQNANVLGQDLSSEELAKLNQSDNCCHHLFLIEIKS